MTYYTIPGLPNDLVSDDEKGIRRIKIGVNPGVINGSEALTVQAFTELNCKSGRQYEASAYIPVLAAGTSSDIVFEIGDEPVILKEVILQFDSKVISTASYRSPDYTGGALLDVYNMSDRDPVAQDIVIKLGVAVSSVGVQISPTITTIGSEGVGNLRIGSISAPAGIERILRENTNYLLRVTNLDTIAARISAHATWYQGGLSTDIGGAP